MLVYWVLRDIHHQQILHELGPNRHISPSQILHELGPKGQISQAQMLHGLGPKGHISPATILHELGPKVLDALTFELVNYVGVEGEYNPPMEDAPSNASSE